MLEKGEVYDLLNSSPNIASENERIGSRWRLASCVPK